MENKIVIDIDAFLAEENKIAPAVPYVIKILGLELSIPAYASVHLMLFIKSLYTDQEEKKDLSSEKVVFGSIIGDEQFEALLNAGASYEHLLLILQIAYLHYQGKDPLEFIKENSKKELKEAELGKAVTPISTKVGSPKKKKIQ